jgi:hypothetical protein
MESQVLQLPQKIYINKQKLKQESIIYGIVTLSCLFGFWYGTGKFFTEDYYYPKMVIFMPIFFTILLIQTIKKYKTASNNDALFSFSEKGIELFDEDYIGMGIIPWSEITGCSENETGGSYFGSAKMKLLCINVKSPLVYLDKMKNISSRKKIIKFNNKNKINSVYNIESANLGVDITLLKRTIYQMVEKAKN